MRTLLQLLLICFISLGDCKYQQFLDSKELQDEVAEVEKELQNAKAEPLQDSQNPKDWWCWLWEGCKKCSFGIAQEFPQIKCEILRLNWTTSTTHRAGLQNALADPHINIVKIPVVLGTIRKQKPSRPIPGFPHWHDNKYSLEEMLDAILEHNKPKRVGKKKGVKLQFFDNSCFLKSLKLIDKYYRKFQRLMVLNADIVMGPDNSIIVPPMSPKIVESHAKKFPLATLMIGWSATIKPGHHYEAKHINNMVKALRVEKIGNPLTISARAVLAANSKTLILKLLKEVPSAVLTLWTRRNDTVNVNVLNEIIRKVGYERTFFTANNAVKRGRMHIDL